MNQAVSNNDFDRNNDTIKMFGGLWQRNTKRTSCRDTTVSNMTVKAKFERARKVDIKHFLIYILVTERHKLLTAGVHLLD